mmetsp:Transcript_19077/g.47689  ORF Transcript_19077/g.47689 Transcript_19077/m.47689 type:complete len:86 (-) Transcript_19077:552-809(-)
MMRLPAPPKGPSAYDLHPPSTGMSLSCELQHLAHSALHRRRRLQRLLYEAIPEHGVQGAKEQSSARSQLRSRVFNQPEGRGDGVL